jgi:hypothetical protein
MKCVVPGKIIYIAVVLRNKHPSSADRERAMETLFFLLILGAFILLKQIPKEQKKQILLRIEYELYKWGFIEYKD